MFRLILILALFPCDAYGQDASSADVADRFWLSGQANFITQGHPTFTAPYIGPNSLWPEAQAVTSRVLCRSTSGPPHTLIGTVMACRSTTQ